MLLHWLNTCQLDCSRGWSESKETSVFLSIEQLLWSSWVICTEAYCPTTLCYELTLRRTAWRRKCTNWISKAWKKMIRQNILIFCRWYYINRRTPSIGLLLCKLKIWIEFLCILVFTCIGQCVCLTIPLRKSKNRQWITICYCNTQDIAQQLKITIILHCGLSSIIISYSGATGDPHSNISLRE